MKSRKGFRATLPLGDERIEVDRLRVEQPAPRKREEVTGQVAAVQLAKLRGADIDSPIGLTKITRTR